MVEFFNNGFEEGDFSAWTGVVGTPSIVTSPVHHGTKAAELIPDERVYQTISAVGEAFGRCYYQNIHTIDPNTYRIVAELTESDKDSCLARALCSNVGGTTRWQLQIRKSDGSYPIYTDVISTPQINTWYSVEVWFKKNTMNGAKLWIDGNLVLTATDTTYNGNIYNYELRDACNGGIFSDYYDCVVVADAYIGPEEEAEGQPYVSRVQQIAGMSSWTRQLNQYRKRFPIPVMRRF